MKKKTYYGIFFLILFSIGLWMIPNVHGIFFPPDEYGYWANAAALWGCDWTEVNRLNMYYSYGYSMVLLPILEIGEEAAKLLNGSIQSAPIYSYRIAIGVNILFVWFHGVILWKISEHLFPKMNEKRRSIICICAACYPSVLVYMHYTLAEVALNLVFLILVWQVIRYAEALKIQHKRKAYLEAVKLAVIAGFLYIVHMRTIGIWAALGIVLCVDAFFIKNEKNLGIEKDNQNNRDAWNTQKRGAIIFLLTSLILFLGAELVKDLLQKQLYGNTALDIISLNDYSGRFGAVMRLFSISGLVDFAVSCAGKLFYLGNTTFGLYYFAVFLLWRKCREEKKQEKIVWYFLLGAVVFNFGISALATAGPGRVDALIYGRYNETIMPVMVCLGLIEIVKQTRLWKKTAVIVVLHGFLLGIVSIYSNVHDLTDWLPDFAVGIAYATGLMPDTVREVLLPPYISGIVGIILLCFLIRLVQRKKLAFEWMSALAAVYVGMMIIICAQNIRPHQWDNLGNIQITQTINRLQEMEPDREVWLLHSWGNENIDTLQFYLPKQRIHVIPEEEFDLFALDERDLIVTYRDDERDEALGMLYRMVERSWHLNLHYNP